MTFPLRRLRQPRQSLRSCNGRRRSAAPRRVRALRGVGNASAFMRQHFSIYEDCPGQGSKPRIKTDKSSQGRYMVPVPRPYTSYYSKKRSSARRKGGNVQSRWGICAHNRVPSQIRRVFWLHLALEGGTSPTTQRQKIVQTISFYSLCGLVSYNPRFTRFNVL